MTSFFCEKTPTTMSSTCDDMRVLLNKQFDSRIELNLFDSSATA
jgi:hypothetical protein